MGSQSNTEEFIQKAIAKHGNKYSYEKVEYVRGHSKVIVTCLIHGDFLITPSNLLSGRTCRKCAIESSANKRIIPFSEYVEKANKIHNSKYTYPEQEYFGVKSNIRVICPKHGEFTINPITHLRNSGCRECSKEICIEQKALTTEEFIEKARVVHSDIYDYSKTIYTRMVQKLTITCKVHGDFEQTAGNHLSGRGCCNCKEFGGYKNSKPGTFYILINDNVIKVGITNRKINRRLRDIQRSSGLDFTLHTSVFSENGKVAQELEQVALRWLKSKYQAVTEIFDGSTECFTDVDLNELIKLTIK